MNAPTYITIEADASHIPFLAAFGRSSFIHAYQCTLPYKELEKYTATAFSKEAIRSELVKKSSRYFVCLNPESRPCGYAKILPSPPPECIGSDRCLELHRLYVDESCRGQGIGKLLSECCESHARNRGIDTLWLRVWDGNIPAQQTYLKWDYAIVGEESYPVGEEQRIVLLMRKTIAG